MWQKASTNFEAVKLVRVCIGQERRELQDLVERGVRAGGFGVVEYVGHAFILRSRHKFGCTTLLNNDARVIRVNQQWELRCPTDL